jgi:hypothetical protein
MEINHIDLFHDTPKVYSWYSFQAISELITSKKQSEPTKHIPSVFSISD